MKLTRKGWKLLFATLPHGLTATKAAKRLRQPYQSTLRYGRIFGYAFVDGRKFRWGESKKPARFVLDPRKVDWKKSNVEIVRDILRREGRVISRERVRVVRKSLGFPMVESRGAKPKTNRKTKP